MYYILNETKQIIAADDSLLTLCGVTHIDELYANIVKGTITVDVLSEGHIKIITEDEEYSFDIEETLLSSLLGNFTLVNVSSKEKAASSSSITENSMIEDNHLSDLLMPEESAIEEDILLPFETTESEEEETPLLLLEETSEEVSFTQEDDNRPEETLTSDDDMMLLNDNLELPEADESLENTALEDNIDDSELFDLLKDDFLEKESSLNEIEKNDTLEIKEESVDNFLLKTEEPDISEITIDIEKNSQIIGISSEDYTHFFNEFIDTALDLEKDLQSEDSDTRTNAVETLSHLSDVLHLPTIGEIMTKISHAQGDEHTKLVESFYTTLSRLTTSKETDKTPTDIAENETAEVETFELEKETLELFDEPMSDEPLSIDEPTIQDEIKARKTNSAESFGTISLEGIKPKHFDFQLEEAANDLSLPVELIEEFVHDFIEQAHIETKKMLQAYEEGDLDTIQKIGHLLKGASSNLRINPLSDTLYKIQFCENPEDLEDLIKDYWAHFLSFEHQINIISN